MTTRRQLLAVLGAGLLTAPRATFAQQQKVHRIGFLGAASASSWAREVEALRAGLRDLGYVEGKTFVLEPRWAEGRYERFPDLVADLLAARVDVIVTHATPGTLAAKRATSTVPIVVAHAGDVVATGIVSNLARPGGNITGSSFFSPELSAKRLELLKQAVPRASRVAVLANPQTPITKADLEVMAATAQALSLTLEVFEVRGSGELADAFRAMAARRVDAVTVLQDGMLNANTAAIAELAAAHRFPSTGFKQFAEAGGLIGYGVDFLAMYRRAAHYVDRILKGARPGELAMERPTRFELVINRATAKALGVAIPQQLLLQADKLLD